MLSEHRTQVTQVGGEDVVAETGTIIVDYRDGVVVLTLVGEHDLTTADELRTMLVEQTEHDRGVVVNLAEVEFIDSSIIHVLYSADLVMLNFGRRLVFHVSGHSPVRHLLEIAGIDTLRCCDSMDEAVELAAQRYGE